MFFLITTGATMINGNIARKKRFFASCDHVLISLFYMAFVRRVN